MESYIASGAVSFDLFGTLVDVKYPSDPAAAVASELEKRGIVVPDDWAEAYSEPHIDAPEGAEIPLPAHVSAALTSRGAAVNATDNENGNVIRRAVLDAFDPEVHTRSDAPEAVESARGQGPVGVLSNCSVPELAHRALARSKLVRDMFDGVVTSVGCGWRKPDHRAFNAIATELNVPLSDIVHIGDDPYTDGGAADIGATAILIDDVPLREVPSLLEAQGWPP